jgi:hypothetical protein
MRRSLELTLTDFSRNALGHEVQRGGLSVSTLLARAALYYLLERESDRLAARVPRLYHEPSAESGKSVLSVTIELRASEWRELDRGAASEGTSVERLLEHAFLLFLVDLESGQAAARLLESADREPD